MTARLERLQKYLAEAELSPEDNKLYIEDLKLSIEYEKTIKPPTFEIQTGFSVDNISENV